MNPGTRTQLHDLYAEWRRLTHLEGEAIRLGDWSRVDEQQVLKHALQTRIARAAGCFRQEAAADGLPDSTFETEFRPVVGELVNLELNNREELCRRREALQAERRTIRQTACRLGGIRRSYAAAPSSSWQSWS